MLVHEKPRVMKVLCIAYYMNHARLQTMPIANYKSNYMIAPGFLFTGLTRLLVLRRKKSL